MRYNDNTIFLLPLLGLDCRIFTTKTSIKTKGGFKGNRFFNSYLQDDLIDTYRDNHIYIVHWGSQDVLYSQFEETIETYPNYKDTYELCGGALVVRIFEIPDQYKAEYQYFKEGKFSKFSKEAQKLCIINSLATTLAGKYNIADILPAIFKSDIKKAGKLRNDWDNFLNLDVQEEKYKIYLSDEDELWSKRTTEQESLTEIVRKQLEQKYNFSLVNNETL